MGKPYFDILEVPVFKVPNATTIGKRTKKGGRFLITIFTDYLTSFTLTFKNVNAVGRIFVIT